MKTQISLVWLYAISMMIAIFSSCKKDDKPEVVPPPTLPEASFRLDDGYVFSDTSIERSKYFNIGILANQTNGNIVEIIIYFNGTKKETREYSSANIEDDFRFLKSVNEEDEIKFVIKNNHNLYITLELSISMSNGAEHYKNIILVNTDGINKDKKIFYSSTSNNTFSYNECKTDTAIQASIDFAFFWALSADSNLLNYCLVSPNQYFKYAWGFSFDGWHLKETEFRTQDEFSFSDIDMQFIIDNFDNFELSDGNITYPHGSIFKNVETDSSIVFKNNKGNFGIIKINDVTENTGNFDQEIDFDVKYQNNL